MKSARFVLYLLIGLCFGANFTFANAAAYQSYQGSAYRNINGTMYWKGDNGSVGQSNARVIESIRVGGAYVGVPYVGAVGAAAASALLAGIKTTPGAFLTSALASWLLSQGIKYIDGAWKKDDPASIPENPDSMVTDKLWGWSATTFKYSNHLAACQANVRLISAYNAYPTITSTLVDSLNANCFISGNTNNPGTFNVGTVSQGAVGCKSGYHVANGQCVRNADVPKCPTGYASRDNLCWPTEPIQVTESDWDKFNGVTPPDAVMNDLCKRLFALDGKGCQVANARAQAVTEPLSESYTDPATGQQVKQVAKVTPAPTADDPFRIMIDTAKETTTITTDPVTGQQTQTKSETPNENEDFCTLHPNALACQELGDPPDAPELVKKDVPVSLTPDAGWGASGATCPADLTYTTHKGILVKLSWSPVCQMANTFRPVVIGIAWLTAVMLFMGISRRVS